jgi:hypothetical protein
VIGDMIKGTLYIYIEYSLNNYGYCKGQNIKINYGKDKSNFAKRTVRIDTRVTGTVQYKK